MEDGEEQEQERETFEEVRDEIINILDNAESLLEEQVDLDASIPTKGSEVISDLVGELLPLIRAVSEDVSYSTDVAANVNARGVYLLGGEVILFTDGNMWAACMGPGPTIDFAQKFLEEHSRLDTFLQLLEELVKIFVEAVTKIENGRKAGLQRIGDMKTSVQTAVKTQD